MRRIPLLAATLLLAAAPSLFAWNGTGHRVVAHIAWQNLTPEAKARIGALLRQHPAYDSVLLPPQLAASLPPEARDELAFEIAATWPDLVRAPNTPGNRYNHPAWHYVDFPYVLGDIPRPDNPVTAWTPGADPINASQAFKKNMADLPDGRLPEASRAIALAWIEHLAGDVHQPLHAVSLFSPDFPRGDQGGNQLIVNARHNVINLHAFWDGILGNYQETDAIAHVADRIATAHPRSEFPAALNVADFDKWALESFDLAKTVVYDEGKIPYLRRDRQAADRTAPVPELSGDYLDRAKAAAETRIALAGYRLAQTLNHTLVPPSTAPAATP
jgi:hypothetical protein